MTSTPDPSGDVVPDARHALKEEFRDIDERLRAMVEMYDEEPSMIDSGATSDAPPRVNVESAIKEAYKLMNARIYAADSPLQRRVKSRYGVRSESSGMNLSVSTGPP